MIVKRFTRKLLDGIQAMLLIRKLICLIMENLIYILVLSNQNQSELVQ
jgi:hypothetical protein